MSRQNRNKRSNRNRVRKARPKRSKQRFNDTRLQITNIENKPVLTRSIRYQSALNSTNAMTFYTTDLLTMLVWVTNASTTVNALFDSIKINSISLSAYQTSGNLESVSFKWETVNGPESLETMVTQSAIMARGTFYPPENSSAAWWFNAAVTQYELFSITASATTLDIIMDINYRCIMNDGPSPLTATLSVASTFTGIAARAMPATTSGALRQFNAVGLNQVG